MKTDTLENADLKDAIVEEVGALPIGPHRTGKLIRLLGDQHIYQWDGAVWKKLLTIDDTPVPTPTISFTYIGDGAPSKVVPIPLAPAPVAKSVSIFTAPPAGPPVSYINNDVLDLALFFLDHGAPAVAMVPTASAALHANPGAITIDGPAAAFLNVAAATYFVVAHY